LFDEQFVFFCTLASFALPKTVRGASSFMPTQWQNWFDRLRPKVYGRKQPVVLINGLAEQAESWYRNYRFWSRYFDVQMPNILAYEGAALHRRINDGLPITVDYLVDQLHLYLEQFVQRPPYHIVASSLGGKVAVEFAARYPELVSRMVLICPSGMGDEEKLPFMEGVRHNDMASIVKSVFYQRNCIDRDMVTYYKRVFPSRRWKTGLLRTVRGTMNHVVRPKLGQVKAPTLFVACENDRIVDPVEAETAVRELGNGHFLMIPKCGHAPQIEKPWLINRLVVHFLTAPNPSSNPGLTQLLLTNPPRVPQ